MAATPTTTTTTTAPTTKVFVGNLAFKTKANELAQHFGESVKVLGAKIITRRGRSLGYGFVEVDNDQDAQKAVSAMDKKEIDGRQINVEVARPREEGEGEQQQQQQDRGGFNDGFRGRGRGRGGRGRGRGRGGFFRGRGGYQPRYQNEGIDAGTDESYVEQEDYDRPRRRGGFFRGGRGRGSFRGGRGGRPQGPDTRVESKTSLFVANLPFALDDAAFGKVFTDANLKFKTAHVVTKRNGRSKGFGFVEFESNEDQQKALQTLNGKQVDGRELTLKVALTDDRENKPQQQGGASNVNDNTQAPAKEEPKKI